MKLKICLVCTALALSNVAFAQAENSVQDNALMLNSASQTSMDNGVSNHENRTILNYDPYAPYNRWMDGVNDTVDRNVIVPVARGYRKAVPGVVRAGARNFFNNLRDVWSFGSNVLRLDVKRASEDLVRVGLNTTFGLGGLIDIASEAQMPNNKNGLGDTFASWGWKNSHYFVMPLIGPSTVRDGVATSLALAYSVDRLIIHDRVYQYASPIVFGIDLRESVLDLTDSLEMAAMDPYSYKRDVFMNIRAKQIGLDIPQADDVDIDDLVDEGSSVVAPADATVETLESVEEVATMDAAHAAMVANSLDSAVPSALMENLSAHVVIAGNAHEGTLWASNQ